MEVSSPILNIAATVGNAKILDDPVHFPPYHGYKRVQVVDGQGNMKPIDLSAGTKGSNVFLWVRKKNHAGPKVLGKHGTDADHHVKERVKKVIREHATLNHGLVNLEQWLKSYMGKDDCVSAARFIEMLNQTGIHLSKHDAKALMAQVDRDGNGRIDMQEFYDFLEFDPVAMKRVLEKVRRQVLTGLEMGQTIDDIFQEFDVEGRGYIDKRQFQAAMARQDVNLTSRELSQVLNAFDTNGDKTVDIDEFVKFANDGGAALNRPRSSRSTGSARRSRSPQKARPQQFTTKGTVRSSRESRRTLGGNGGRVGEAVEFFQNIIDDLGMSGRRAGAKQSFDWHTAWGAFAGDVDRMSVAEFERAVTDLGKRAGNEILRRLNTEELSMLVDHFDCDGDGYVTFDEFCEGGEDEFDPTASHGGGRRRGNKASTRGGKSKGLFFDKNGGGRSKKNGRGGRRGGGYTSDDDDEFYDDHSDAYEERKSRERKWGSKGREGSSRSRSFPAQRRRMDDDPALSESMDVLCKAITKKAKNYSRGAGRGSKSYDWQRVWHMFDADQDGFITFDEFTDAYHALGISRSLTKRQLGNLMRYFDRRGDDHVRLTRHLYTLFPVLYALSLSSHPPRTHRPLDSFRSCAPYPYLLPIPFSGFNAVRKRCDETSSFCGLCVCTI